MEVIPKVGGNLSLTGHTLVIAGAGGTASLGELAVDAVITTFDLRRVAIVQSPLLLPVAVSSAWKLPSEQPSERLEITTAAELYQSDTVPGLSVLQIRSPPVEGRRRALAKEIWTWASGVGIAQIVVVAPCASYMREDADINSSSPLRYAHIDDNSSNDLIELLQKAGLSEFVLPFAGPAPPEEETSADSSGNRHLLAVQRSLHGGGLTRPLLLEAAEAAVAETASQNSLPKILCLLAYTTSTVDMRTLEQLAKAACALTGVKLGLQLPAMKFPPSWSLEAETLAARPPMYLWN
jgi:hypothetical protein